MSTSDSLSLIPGLLPPPDVILKHAFAGGVATALIAPPAYIFDIRTVRYLKDTRSNRWTVVPNDLERPEGRVMRSSTLIPKPSEFVKTYIASEIPAAAARWGIFTICTCATPAFTSADPFESNQQPAPSNTGVGCAALAGFLSGTAEQLVRLVLRRRFGFDSGHNLQLNALDPKYRQVGVLMQSWSETAFKHSTAMHGVNIGTSMATYAWLAQAWRPQNVDARYDNFEIMEVPFFTRWRAGALAAMVGTAVWQTTDRVLAPFLGSSIHKETNEQLKTAEEKMRAETDKAAGRQKKDRKRLIKSAEMAKHIRGLKNVAFRGHTPRTVGKWMSALGWDMLKAALLGGTVIAAQDALVQG